MNKPKRVVIDEEVRDYRQEDNVVVQAIAWFAIVLVMGAVCVILSGVLA